MAEEKENLQKAQETKRQEESPWVLLARRFFFNKKAIVGLISLDPRTRCNRRCDAYVREEHHPRPIDDRYANPRVDRENHQTNDGRGHVDVVRRRRMDVLDPRRTDETSVGHPHHAAAQRKDEVPGIGHQLLQLRWIRR